MAGGTVGDYPNVGQAETVAQVEVGLASSVSTAAAQQVDAERFIRENGHTVVDGHTPVGEPRSE